MCFMRNCCKYKLLEISGLPSHADIRTIELSRTFRQEINMTVLIKGLLLRLLNLPDSPIRLCTIFLIPHSSLAVSWHSIFYISFMISIVLRKKVRNSLASFVGSSCYGRAVSIGSLDKELTK